MDGNFNKGKVNNHLEGTKITRRDFLQQSSVAVLSLSLVNLRFKGEAFAQAQSGPYPYRSWEDLYRKQWIWDKVFKGSHALNCACQVGCTFDIYVKNGIVLREEQAANYSQTNLEVPDFNPRGCQKGVCYSHRMYDPTRIKYPLKRVGNRGEGKWKRLSWDEALTEIADTIIEVITRDGPDTIIFDGGTHILLQGINAMGFYRNCQALDATLLTINAEIGDHYPGASITLGKIAALQSADDWFYSDLFLIWGGNPFYTHIPNSHFFLEARYNGAKVVTITPDYTPAAIHSDYWVPVNIGTDGALGLSIAWVIIKEGLYNKTFIKEQTDLPFLVRQDNSKYLREQDLKDGGEVDIFYVFDLASRSIKEMPKRSLTLSEIDPALEGEYEVETLQGKVKVKPVFELLKSKLEDYTPEKASPITGIHPDVVRRLAGDIAKAGTVAILTGEGTGKHYHGTLMERGHLLVLALCGHLGKKGSGYNVYCIWFPDSLGPVFAAPPHPSLVEALEELSRELELPMKKLREKGYSDEMMVHELERAAAGKKFVSGTLFFYLHGGIKELSDGRTRAWDPHLKREASEYVEEALQKGWQFVKPAPGKDPKIIIEEGGNILRRVRGNVKLKETLLPKLKMLVTIDWRMSTTGLYSDLVLPCAWVYEREDFVPGLSAPYINISSEAVKPVGDSKTDWEIHCLLAKKIQERAQQKGILTFKDTEGKDRRLDKLYDDLTFQGTYTEGNSVELIKDIIKSSTNMEGVTWEELKEVGHARVTSIGEGSVHVGGSLAISQATDIKPTETITPFTWHVEKKIPWPTLTRRIQFYIDNDLFLELGEELPTHKPSSKMGGDYPLQMTGGHTRWSIQTNSRDQSYMLRLQRGVPVIYMSKPDAEARGIKDGEEVEVKNDINSFRIHCKVSPAVRPGQVIVYHAWEPYMFKERKNHQCLTPTPINPIELGGGYFHLRPMVLWAEPGCKDRGTRVEVVKIT